VFSTLRFSYRHKNSGAPSFALLAKGGMEPAQYSAQIQLPNRIWIRASGRKNECPITLRQKSTEGNHAPEGSL
jgi:hypothetical protein